MAVILLGVALGLSYVLYTFVYNLYFHPLASFPGPLLARVSVIPSWWNSRHGDRSLWLLSLQEKYGKQFFLLKANVKQADRYRRPRISLPPGFSIDQYTCLCQEGIRSYWKCSKIRLLPRMAQKCQRGEL